MSARFGEIEKAERGLVAAQRSFLQTRGWQMTCEVPGAFWVWRKSFRDRVFLMPTDLAVRVQRSMDMMHMEREE